MTLRVPRTAWLSATALLLLAGCTDRPTSRPASTRPAVPAGAIRLAAFDSCAQLLDGLRTSAKAAVGPYGFGGPEVAADAAAGAPGARADSGAKGAVPAQPDGGSVPNYSGTNTNEAGVDEPDLVKTDGKRIVTVSGGVLRVVDVASRRITGQLALTDEPGGPRLYRPGELLLSGNRALVLVPGGYMPMRGGPVAPGIDQPEPADVLGPRLLLVDLSGAPTIVGRYTVDGNLVDARQTGDTVRVVVRSAPRLLFPNADRPLTEAQRTAVNEAYVDRTGVDDWLPRYTVDDTTGHHTGRVDCTAVSRPARYTGGSMLTVLTFDLGRPALGTGDPVTIVADGSTVYGTGPSLYIAGYQDRELPRMPARTTTELYRFDTSKPGRPVFAASGEVPGYLLNQYALSEWNGHLRIATTSVQPWAPPVPVPGGAGGAQPRPPQAESTVYTLTERGGQLVEAGHVGGLGKGERIYAVRFLGGTGYVVTFRRTDPLYTLDLREPSAPRVAGELKINGYSSYLHPAGDGRLLGIGQDATSTGRVQGMQVSLFDVGDPARPTRLAQYKLGYGYSEAEYEPHAFLYWPATKLLVVPVYQASSGAVALRVGDSAFTELGTVTHPASGPIRRSLVVGDTLWTVSDGGLAADQLRSGASPLARVAWLPYS